MRAHEFAGLFPLVDDAGLADLAADIAAHGQREPVLLFEGQILDGRNRYAACIRAGIEPRCEPAPVETREAALALVVSLNLHRRHLTESQRAMVAARLVPLYEGAARERQGRRTDLAADLQRGGEPETARASVVAAAAVNVSPRSAYHAGAVLDRGSPDLVAAVDRGVLAVSAAAQAARLPEDEQLEVVSRIETGEAKSGAEALRQVEESRRPHVAHNSGNNEWYTPAAYIEAARVALGGIDLDPASSEVANATVGAARFYTAESDGLAQEWAGRVWMNPPYESGLIDRFAAKLREEYDAGRVDAAVVLVNNATETRWFRAIGEAARAVCFPSGRVRFLRPEGVLGAPLQGQAVLYLGDDVDGFRAAFGAFGLVFLGGADDL